MKFALAGIALVTAAVVNARAITKRDSFSLCQSNADCTVPGETCFEYIQYGQASNFTSCQNRSGPGNTCNFDTDCQATEFCNAFGHGIRGCVRKATDVPEGTLCKDSTGCRTDDVCVAYSDSVSACVREFDPTAVLGDECSTSKDCSYNADCIYNTTSFFSQCTRNDGPDSPPVVQGLPYPLPSSENGTETNSTISLPASTTSLVPTPMPANATESVATPLPANATSPAVNTATSEVASSQTSTSPPSKESVVVVGGETSHAVPIPAPATKVPTAHPTSTEIKSVGAAHPIASATGSPSVEASQAPTLPVQYPAQATQGSDAPAPVVASIVSVMSAMVPNPSAHPAPAAEPMREAAPVPATGPVPIACPSVDLGEVLKQLQEIKSELACFKDILYSMNGTIAAGH